MRILRLEIEGFGPYLEAQSIDFTTFEVEGLFAITGKTGAGKSTILDAICFALYDRVPRYEKAEPVLRSHFCGEDDATSVALEYELGGHEYRVWRSPAYERAKKRGTGTTTKGAEAKLYIRRGGEWEILAAMPREVGEWVASTVPLTGEQFLQVILLAQGRFAEFLRADTSERRTVLRSLFGTRRFEDLEQEIRELARVRSAAVEAADATLAGLVARAAGVAGVDSPPVPEREAFWEQSALALASAVESSGDARVAAARAADGAAAALSDAREVERVRTRLGSARATVASLEEQAEEQAAREVRIAAARTAVPVIGPLREAERAGRASEEAASRLEATRAAAVDDVAAGLAWPTGDLAAADEAALRVRASELATERGAVAAALGAERSLPALEAGKVAASAALEAAEAARVETAEALALLPGKETELRQALDGAAVKAARVEDLAGAVARAEASVEAHALVAVRADAMERAAVAEAHAAAAHAAAAAAHADLVERRLRSQAAHLAADLVEGEPCPVCGGTEHPSPAQPSDTHVEDAQVEEAFASLESAAAVLARARETRGAADIDLAAAREKAGDGDASQAATALEAARADHAAAVTAAAERDRLTGAIAAMAARRNALTETLEAQAAAVTQAQEQVTRAGAALENARTLATAPEGYATVAEFAATLDAAKTLVEGLIRATETAEDSASAAAKARAALAEALASSGLADADAVRAAALGTSELAAFEAEAERHRSALAAARAVVEELSERELPVEAADLEALTAAAAETGAARDAAIEAATRATARASEFAALRREYEELGDSTAAARAERDVVLTLADALEGKAPNERRLRLESFVLASKLEKIVAAANARLTTMSSGQYQLEHDDSAQYRGKETGLALRIADAHTGQSRSTRSLSGGETFLASLSLALGLAETVTAEAGGIELSTLFIDEGFGSLDGDTLEVAMSTLNDLRDSGRTVGLISHVEAMHDAIPAQLEVVKAADGSSRVQVRTGTEA